LPRRIFDGVPETFEVEPLLVPVSALAVPALIKAAPDVLARANAAIVAILPNFIFFIINLYLKIFSYTFHWR
jgi:hypothetical protein